MTTKHNHAVWFHLILSIKRDLHYIRKTAASTRGTTGANPESATGRMMIHTLSFLLVAWNDKVWKRRLLAQLNERTPATIIIGGHRLTFRPDRRIVHCDAIRGDDTPMKPAEITYDGLKTVALQEAASHG